ncbi:MULTISPECIES: winged helix-turn-helix transcriptional regulator [Streptomyces]|uniref:winged helix-turn-helix transcriptional regulator n=1 Tax=Streptomyces lycopersici TaxID=2974589 RepID=UPI0021D1B9E6|nr:helix-turn-helix domain-containing protein [Streptomyces sp. NEAU-383]
MTATDPPWDPYARECPSRDLLNRIGDKWTVLVLGELADQRPHRFASIRDRIEGISEKMLTQTLRHLEEDGLISRQVYPEVPPRVEYQLTSLGVTLRGPLAVLREWSVSHATDVLAAREEYARTGLRRCPS